MRSTSIQTKKEPSKSAHPENKLWDDTEKKSDWKLLTFSYYNHFAVTTNAELAKILY